MEEWRFIHQRYQISSAGRVRGLRGSLIKQMVDPRGYTTVSMTVGAKVKQLRVHRLVAQAFLPNPDNKRTVNHRNWDPADNRLENLEWATHREQAAHSRHAPTRRSQPVLQLTLDDEVLRSYPSTLAASKVVAPNAVGGGPLQAIRKCVRGIRPTALGFKWKLVAHDTSLEWRSIPECEGYFVSCTGIIRLGVKVLNQKMSAQGYWKVTVRRNGKQGHAMVHRLVAEAFLVKPEDATIVDHLDGNKTHNAVTNLDWCTPAENSRRAIANGLRKSVRPVIASNADGGETRYPSSGAAGDALGIPGISIWKLCKGLTTYNTSGMNFRYA